MSALQHPEDPDPQTPRALGELRFNRLLVAIDGSASGELALLAAVTAARHNRSAVTLLTVVADFAAEAMRWSAAVAPDLATLQTEGDAAAEALLREAIARIPADIPVTTVMRRGKAGREIVAQTECQHYDAVLLGARGVGRVGTLLGSVSNYVMHRAHTTVFVAHSPS